MEKFKIGKEKLKEKKKFKIGKDNLKIIKPKIGLPVSKKLATSLTVDLICGLLKITYPHIWFGRPLTYSFRTCVEKIVQVLQTGQQWESVGTGWSSFHKRFTEWSDANIFSDAFYLIQKIPSFANAMGTSFYIDACVIRNKCGRDEISYCYKIKCKRSVKISVIIGSNGLPVSLCVSKSSVHDVKFVLPALSKIKLRTRKIKTLIADKGYQSIKLRKDFKKQGINYIYHQKKNLTRPFILTLKEKVLFDKRYTVEGAFSTILANRRLNVRYEQKQKHFESFIYLAMIHTIYKKLGPL